MNVSNGNYLIRAIYIEDGFPIFESEKFYPMSEESFEEVKRLIVEHLHSEDLES